jgi:hypothetical protein
MKVIKEGRDQSGWVEEFNCTGEGNGLGGCGPEVPRERESP